MRGNSTIMLGALNEGNKASVCVSKLFEVNKIANISKTGNITYENNLTTYKLRILFTMLVFCMVMVFGGKAIAQETLTVYDGTTTNSYVPIYGLYADYGTRSQFVIPSSELSEMEGGNISTLTFYCTPLSLCSQPLR